MEKGSTFETGGEGGGILCEPHPKVEKTVWKKNDTIVCARKRDDDKQEEKKPLHRASKYGGEKNKKKPPSGGGGGAAPTFLQLGEKKVISGGVNKNRWGNFLTGNSARRCQSHD